MKNRLSKFTIEYLNRRANNNEYVRRHRAKRRIWEENLIVQLQTLTEENEQLQRIWEEKRREYRCLKKLLIALNRRCRENQ